MSKRTDVRKKYEQLKNSNLDQELKQLANKVKEKTISSEEYKKYNRLLKIKQNMPKIENILEYRDVLINDSKEIEKEIVKREQLETAKKENEKLENSLTEMLKEKGELQKKLKKAEKPEEKIEIEEKIKKIDSTINENNSEFKKNQHIINNGKEMEDSNLMEELQKAKENTMTKISKCNMVANNLIRGLSWSSIEVNLDKWKERKYTTGKEDSKKIKKKKEARKSEGKDEKRPIEGVKKIVQNIGKKIEQYNEINNLTDFEEEPKKKKENNKDNKLPVEVSEFDKKHPRIAKMKNWFKKIFKSDKETKTTTEEIKELKGEREDFKKYLKEIAEKGYEQVEKDHKDERRKNAKDRFEKMKEEAYKRETERYGKDYAEKSYHKDEGIEK